MRKLSQIQTARVRWRRRAARTAMIADADYWITCPTRSPRPSKGRQAASGAGATVADLFEAGPSRSPRRAR
jgi:hypothetical protein